MPDEDTTVAQLKQRMVQFIDQREWGKYHRPKNLAMSLAIESAELMEHFQWLDHDESQALMNDDAVRGQVADELADILAFLLSLANCTGIDLASAFQAKMAKNEVKYPADEVRGQYRRPDRDRG